MNSRTKYLLLFLAAVGLGLGLLGFISYTRYQQANALVLEVTTSNFQKEVAESKIPVYVEFYVDFDECEPCKNQAPVIEKLAAEYAGKVKFVRVHAKKQIAISRSIGLSAVPTHIFLDPATGNGVMAEGLLDEAALRAFLEQGLAGPQPTPAPTPDPNAQPTPPNPNPTPAPVTDPNAQPTPPNPNPTPAPVTDPNAQPTPPNPNPTPAPVTDPNAQPTPAPDKEKK